jgi:hypothetical protein
MQIEVCHRDSLVRRRPVGGAALRLHPALVSVSKESLSGQEDMGMLLIQKERRETSTSLMRIATVP